MMNTAHEIVQNFIADQKIEIEEFNEWFRDCGFCEEEANPHDSRHLMRLEQFVEERKGERSEAR